MPPGGHPPKYLALQKALERVREPEVTLTFVQIALLLAAPLPESTWQRGWWGNQPAKPQARSWLLAGWRVAHVSVRNELATFVRRVTDG